MKGRRGFLVCLAGISLITACVGRPRTVSFQNQVLPPQEAEQRELYQVVDYKTKNQGGEIPPWVSQYLEEGNRGVEKLPEFENKYVFVSEVRGPDDRIFRQWIENFNVDQDFARLAAVRIEGRLIQAARYYPDDEYGAFFEAAVKAAFNAFYNGAAKEDVFWVSRLLFEADGITVNRLDYSFLILAAVEKTLFEAQVNDILSSINPEPPPSREQAAAISRLKNNFFDGF